MLKWIHNRRMVNKTRRTLSLLSDRDLKDIGISRGDISNISRNWNIKNAR